jgi:hypothetical protein
VLKDALAKVAVNSDNEFVVPVSAIKPPTAFIDVLPEPVPVVKLTRASKNVAEINPV